MAISVLPSTSFSDVQRYLRQRRATGQTVSPQSERAAWEGYYNSVAANRIASADIGLRTRHLDLEEQRLSMLEDQQKAQEDAAKVSGIAELGSTAVLGGMVLKDTSLGSKIGLGASTATPRSAAVAGAAPKAGAGAAPYLSAPGAAYEAGIMAPVKASPTVTGLTETSAVSSLGGLQAPTAASSLTGAGAAGAAGLGVGAGFIGAAIGKQVAGDKGSVVGGVGAGAGAGFMVGGPVGAVIGGVVGGLTGILKGKK